MVRKILKFAILLTWCVAPANADYRPTPFQFFGLSLDVAKKDIISLRCRDFDKPNIIEQKRELAVYWIDGYLTARETDENLVNVPWLSDKMIALPCKNDADAVLSEIIERIIPHAVPSQKNYSQPTVVDIRTRNEMLAADCKSLHSWVKTRDHYGGMLGLPLLIIGIWLDGYMAQKLGHHRRNFTEIPMRYPTILFEACQSHNSMKFIDIVGGQFVGFDTTQGAKVVNPPRTPPAR